MRLGTHSVWACDIPRCQPHQPCGLLNESLALPCISTLHHRIIILTESPRSTSPTPNYRAPCEYFHYAATRESIQSRKEDSWKAGTAIRVLSRSPSIPFNGGSPGTGPLRYSCNHRMSTDVRAATYAPDQSPHHTASRG